MKKAFIIDGGLGRCLCSLPALIKYARKHPDEEWYVVMAGWTSITYGIKELQDRTYELESKGVFDNIFMKVDQVISTEPYRVPEFYKKQISLIEAFDVEINNDSDHTDLERPPIIFSEYEELKGREIVSNAIHTHKKDKTIVFQPYGSSAQKIQTGIFDDTLRSIPEKVFLKLSKMLSEKYNVIYFGDYDFYTREYSHCLGPAPDPTIREWFSVINNCDYFIGCDSCGQHAAYSLGVPGTVIIGGTDSTNMSYPKHFNIIQKQQDKKYIPMRISSIECDLAQRFNKGILNYDDDEINQLYSIIISCIENNYANMDNLDIKEKQFKKQEKNTKSKIKTDSESSESLKNILHNFDYS